jgi:hypothetical protein
MTKNRKRSKRNGRLLLDKQNSTFGDVKITGGKHADVVNGLNSARTFPSASGRPGQTGSRPHY